ncbi:MAG: WecB/TagA/CpsF family glycosyltransferase [Pseudomonadota bacterium]|nr:WecB/TagA/CpsF family glycosyltransferase [Pseudomonadota bacterium]
MDKSLSVINEQVLPMTVQFSNCDLPEFMRIAASFGSDAYAYAVTPNVDHLIRFCDDASFRELYRTAGFVLLDSRFLAALLRVVSGLRLPTSPGSDVTAQLFDSVIAPDDKIVVLGGTDQQAAILCEKYGLRSLRHLNPPMGFINDPVAVDACLRFIENESPFRFCLLAVGSPQQELLAKALQTRGRARGLVLCVGASVDFLTGRERRAPKWIQNISFEWLYRLVHNPGRLAGRYLVRGPRIFFLLPRLKFSLRPPAPLTPESP